MLERLMQWLGGSAAAQPLETTIDRFMQGESIPKISSGAGDIIAEQRKLEGEIRSYIWAQDEYVTRLEAQLSQLLAERDSTR